ncbi:Ger(x)C family spore germination protein [Halobacillus sp. Marseille-Q1614]|uniref:Ger(x)C family spore germination protein n=1 Tax=Halobacillus sp. Marseille-Q1614 TaxID=2709134 RepID=UPI00156DA8EE|nr:Ger(x)C family spore germination protein [Halobacillus sp. Marseille-Q1614]
MKKKLTSVFLVLTACLVFLSGCWDSREMDDLGIGVALGIDKTEEGKYVVYVQLINPSEIATEAPSTRPPVSLYKEEGDTLFEALRKMTTTSPRRVYLSQLRLVVLSSALAEEGILSTLDFLYRDHNMRTSFFLTVAKDSNVEDILSVITAYEKIPANKVMDTLKNAEESWAATHGVNIDDVISDIHSKGIHPVMTGVTMKGSEEIGNNISNVENIDSPTRLEVDNLAIFKGDRLIGWLNEDESKGYNDIAGNVKGTIVNLPCEEGEGKVAIEIIRTQAAIESEMNNEKPAIIVSLEAEANVGEVQCDIDLSKIKTIKKLDEQLEKTLKDRMELAIDSAQEKYKSDIFGFGNSIHRQHPKYWKKVEKSWDEHFPELDVKVDVSTDIRRKGTTAQPAIKEG